VNGVITMTEKERLEAILGERFERIKDRFEQSEKRIDERFESMGEALRIAASEMNRRLEGMNEFRAQINAAENKYMTRQEWDSAHRLLEAQVRALETRMDRKEGETTGVRLTGSLIVTLIIAAAAVFGIITWFITHGAKQ